MILGQKFGLLAMKMVGISIKTCRLLKPIQEYWLISDTFIAITPLMCWICLLKLNGISIPISYFSFPIPHSHSSFIPNSCLDIYIEITPQIFPIPHSPLSFQFPFSTPLPIPYSCLDIYIEITPPICWIGLLKPFPFPFPIEA